MQTSIRTESVSTCPVCEQPGAVLYSGIRDHLFGTPGAWGIRQCGDSTCGTIWLSPRPVPEDLLLAYQSYYTHSERPARDSVWHRAYAAVRNGYLQVWGGYRVGCGSSILRLLAPLALLDPRGLAQSQFNAFFCRAPARPGRLLDVGCGSGLGLTRMRELGWSVFGIDFDPLAVETARQAGIEAGVGGIEDMGFPSGSFDAVFMGHVIEHVLDVPRLLRECARVLKPGGKLVVLTPNARSWGHRRFGEAWRGLEPPRHLQVFTRTSLEAVLRDSGFSVARVRAIARSGAYLFAMSRRIRDAKGRASLDGVQTFGLRGLIDTYHERIRQIVDKDAGSELLAVATR